MVGGDERNRKKCKECEGKERRFVWVRLIESVVINDLIIEEEEERKKENDQWKSTEKEKRMEWNEWRVEKKNGRFRWKRERREGEERRNVKNREWNDNENDDRFHSIFTVLIHRLEWEIRRRNYKRSEELSTSLDWLTQIGSTLLSLVHWTEGRS